jgi:hypothetical protein
LLLFEASRNHHTPFPARPHGLPWHQGDMAFDLVNQVKARARSIQLDKNAAPKPNQPGESEEGEQPQPSRRTSSIPWNKGQPSTKEDEESSSAGDTPATSSRQSSSQRTQRVTFTAGGPSTEAATIGTSVGGSAHGEGLSQNTTHPGGGPSQNTIRHYRSMLDVDGPPQIEPYPMTSYDDLYPTSPEPTPPSSRDSAKGNPMDNHLDRAKPGPSTSQRPSTPPSYNHHCT